MKVQHEEDAGSFLRSRTFWLSIVGGILILIANSALWLNRYIFNEDTFVTTVTTSLTSESSRQAIGQRISGAVFEGRPIAQQVAGDVATQAVSGLLNTQLAETAIEKTAKRFHVVITSPNTEDIEIDLTGIKDVSAGLVNAAAALGRETQVNPDNIPDSITILERDNIPNVYKTSVAFLWIAPIAFIVAIVAFVLPYTKKYRDIKIIALTQGICLAVVGTFGLLIGPLFRPPVLAAAKTSEGRTVLANLYDAFLAPFNNQTTVLIFMGLALVLIVAILYLYPVIRTAIKK